MTRSAIERALMLSVGGSDQPLRSSLSEMRPDRVVFVVSDGSGGSQSSKSQAELLFGAAGCPPERQILQVPPDDPDAALAKIEPVLTRLLNEVSEVTIDYTGGTKSMTSAMVLAATCHEDVRLQFMVGVRSTLDHVEDGTERPTEIPVDLIGLSQTFGMVRAFIGRRNYGAARSVLSETHKSLEELQGRVPRNWRRRVSQWQKWVGILELWDRFDHAGALKILEHDINLEEPYANWFKRKEYARRLRKLAACNQDPCPELLEDLWLNSQRRAELGSYDDAVARLYRLMEAAVQTRLRVRHNLLTSRVPVDRLPNGLKKKRLSRNNDGSVRLGLSDGVSFLRHVEPNNCLSSIWDSGPPSWQGQRNHSVLAHGFKPLDHNDWKQVNGWFEERRCSVWEELLGRSTAEQLPDRMPNLTLL